MMRTESLEFLKSILDAPSPSGYEQPVQQLMRKEMGRYADEVRTDVMGNVTAALNADGYPRIMLAGHCDEIGLIVRHITDDGFIYVDPIGGWDPRILVARRVQIHGAKGPVLGVIGVKAIHMQGEDERRKTPTIDQLWVDIGAANRREAEKRVAIGDPITVGWGLEMVTKDIAVSRAFDDKMGAFVIAETLRLLQRKKFDAAVFAVSTVQEEVGLRGAHASCFGVDPQVALAIEVGHAVDYPTASKTSHGEGALGKGPLLYRGPNTNPVVWKMLTGAADRAKIAYQPAVHPRRGGTDATVMQVSRAGVATGVVSVPLRYMHTPVEMLSLKDLENTAKLVAAFILSLKRDTDFTP
jgi:endoglucanase